MAAAAKKKTARKKPAAKKAAAKTPRLAKISDFDGQTSLSHAARLLGYNEKSFRDEIPRGLPVIQNGKGQTRQVVLADIHKYYLRKAGTQEGGIGEIKLKRQQEELRKQQRENELAEGKLAHIDDVIHFFNAMLVTLSNRLTGIPGKAAAGDPMLRARFLDEIRSCQDGIFRDIVEFLRPFVGDERADSAAAEAVKLGVGAREEDPPKGKRRARAVQPKKNAVGNRSRRRGKQASNK